MIVCGSSTPEKTGQSPLGHFLASGNSTEGLAGQFGHADPIAKRTSSGSTKWPHTAGQEVQRMRHRHPNRRFPHNQTCQRSRLHNQSLFPWNTPWSTPSTWMRPALTKTAAWLHTFAKAFVKTPIDGWKITAVDRCGGPQGWQATQNASAQERRPTLSQSDPYPH